MAFRKTVRCRYFPSVFFHQFGEIKYEPTVSTGPSTFFSRKFVSVSDLVKLAPPSVSLEEVVNSDKPISGSVSFSRNDPALIERDVASSLSTYISNSQSTPNEN